MATNGRLALAFLYIFRLIEHLNLHLQKWFGRGAQIFQFNFIPKFGKFYRVFKFSDGKMECDGTIRT